MIMKRHIIPIFFLWIALTAPRTALTQTLTPESFAKNVHLSYLNGNLQQMTLFIKQALEKHPHDESLKHNLLGVLEKAYTLPNAHDIAPDWHLPKKIRSLDVGLYRHSFENDLFWGYDISIALHVDENTIQDLTLKNALGQIILQKSTGVGKWSESNKAHGEWGARLQVHLGKKPLASGLYTIDVVFADKSTPAFHAWVLVPEAIFNHFPTIKTPEMEQLWTTTTPTFSWDQLVEQWQASYLRSSVTARVESQECKDVGSIFYLSTSTPLQQFQIGTLPAHFQIHDDQAVRLSHHEFENIYYQPNMLFVEGLKSLKNGKHLFTIEQSVDRHFGEMGFGLVTQNTIGFRIDNGIANNTYKCDSLTNDYAKP